MCAIGVSGLTSSRNIQDQFVAEAGRSALHAVNASAAKKQGQHSDFRRTALPIVRELGYSLGVDGKCVTPTLAGNLTKALSR